MANTPNYGWETPDDTDYVYQGASAARTTANAIDATVSSNYTNSAQGIKAYIRSTTETIVPTTTETILMTTNTPFTPVAGRLYKITVTIGIFEKLTNAGTVTAILRKGAGGAQLDRYFVNYDWYTISLAAAESVSWSKIYTSTQLGTTSFTPYVYGVSDSGGARLSNTTTFPGCIIVEDIGPA
jgi:hypothetical protein